jgi:hypothetical protein
MNAKILLLIAASAALAGCPDKAAEKTPAAPKVAATAPPPSAPAPATTAPAASAPVTAAAPTAASSSTISAAACTGTCDVTVPVSSQDGKTCRVGPPSQDVINVGRSPQPTIIKWTLTGAAGFKFAQPAGIEFKNPPPPSNVMQNGAGGAPTVTVTDNHKDDSSKGRWRYTIRVTNGSISCNFDPSVDNN